MTIAHWDRYANNWRFVKPPLRPSKEDLSFMLNGINKQQSILANKKLNAILFGITSEIAEMEWPDDSELIAIERSRGMKKINWPGDIEGRRCAKLGDWLNLQVKDSSVDVVIGDGSFNCVAFPHEFEKLVEESFRVLKQNSCLIMRFFIKPESSETIDDVFHELTCGKIQNFHVFKFRLAMALQKKSEEGVRLGDVYDTWNNSGIDIAAIFNSMNWSLSALETINIYQQQDARLFFPSIEECLSKINLYFHEESIMFPTYEMGERCPTVVFRRKDI